MDQVPIGLCFIFCTLPFSAETSTQSPQLGFIQLKGPTVLFKFKETLLPKDAGALKKTPLVTQIVEVLHIAVMDGKFFRVKVLI